MLLSDSNTMRKTLEQGNMENARAHPEGNNKEWALGIPRELGVRQTKARHLVGADTGKPNDRTKNFNNNGAKTDTPAGSNTTSFGHLRDGQKVIRTTVPAEGNQETTGHPGGQKDQKDTKKQFNETKG